MAIMRGRGMGCAAGVTACVLIAGASASAQMVAQQVVATTTANPLTQPVGVTYAPGDFSRVFVWEKPGRIRTVDMTTNPPTLQQDTSAFLDIRSIVQPPANNSDERGLLGLAFHPQFQTNGKFYVYYSRPLTSGLPTGFTFYNELAEYVVRNPSTLVVDPTLAQADIASARVMMRVLKPQTNHNGGWLAFGPDGYLYITTGDGGNANDAGTGHNATIGNSQDTGSPLGKILRIDVNSTGPAPQGPFWSGGTGATAGVANYGIPSGPLGNPTLPVVTGGTSPARSEIWAYGLRNSWRCSFDRLTGDLWIADVGQNVWEEINIQPALTTGNAAQVRGRNYGWRCFEGTVSFNTNGGLCPGSYNDPALSGPIGVYPHSTAQVPTTPPTQMLTPVGGANPITGCSITGGYVYRGCQIPSLYGQYVFVDYCGGVVFSATINPSTGLLNPPTQWSVYTGSTAVQPNVPAYTLTTTAMVSFGEDAYGELYMCDQRNNRVFRFVPATTGAVPLAHPDFDRNGSVTIGDIFAFLNAWFAADPKSDFDRVAPITTSDIFTFLNAWFRGC